MFSQHPVGFALICVNLITLYLNPLSTPLGESETPRAIAASSSNDVAIVDQFVTIGS